MSIFASRTAARISALLAVTALFGLGAHAQNVGTASAVNPTTQGTSQGAGTRVLRLGSNIISNERIQTSSAGSTQILFVDKSTLNIGPNSSVVIDSYVYNPQTKTGETTLTLGKGIMRFVGGEISHKGGTTVNAGVATVGVRGGSLTAENNRIVLHNGIATITTPCGTATLRRTGYQIEWDGNGCLSDPERVSREEIQRILALVSSKRGEDGGGTFNAKGPDLIDPPNGSLPPGEQRMLDDLVKERAEDTQNCTFGCDIDDQEEEDTDGSDSN